MALLRRTYELLKAPEPVLHFQHLCGVRFESGLGNARVGKSQHNHHHHERNSDVGGLTTGCANEASDVDKGCNGHSQNVHELRSRTLATLPTAAEIEVDKEKRKKDNSSSSLENDDEYNFVIEDSFIYHLLYYLFSFGANLGNEVFYCTFFPFWFWNVDSYVFRRVITLWFVTLYSGQVLKDIIRWPRPPSPPVIRMEKRYEKEYGMPSTHAMVGFIIPFALLYLTMHRYEYDFSIGLTICVCWTSLVSLSRLYLGMHSILDIICGLMCSMAILPLGAPYLDIIDEFLLSSRYAPVVIIFGPIAVLCCLSPLFERGNCTLGDTVQTISVYAGVMLGSWFTHHFSANAGPVDPPPYAVTLPDATWFGSMLLRTCLGVLFLIATRAVMKPLMFYTMCTILRFDRDDPKTKQHILVELPYKFVAYTIVTFNVAFLAPCMFQYLGIERISFYYEF
ncbi:sphingosine-1-phosphate phosphatase 2-like [Tubulanus polymorphus]|uniref:sphingosine-1-phosphate phosphatase 2-like n=1 Tax=Tubulanus polymorphus TaxID=672921 RepID=UPI003DA3E7BE